ncbi:MAG: hypothetical protein LW650_05300, partial [Planctomycetaceae bacterium]|nr:hypothetical protein [Planctomycetaceae bacterium]
PRPATEILGLCATLRIGSKVVYRAKAQLGITATTANPSDFSTHTPPQNSAATCHRTHRSAHHSTPADPLPITLWHLPQQPQSA